MSSECWEYSHSGWGEGVRHGTVVLGYAEELGNSAPSMDFPCCWLKRIVLLDPADYTCTAKRTLLYPNTI